MARRELEKEMLKRDGIEMQPLEKPTKFKVIKEVHFHSTFRGVFSMQFNHSGTLLLIGYGSGGIQKYDGKTGHMLSELRACRQGGHSVMAIRFHPKNEDLVYAATTEGMVHIYDVTTDLEVGHIEERLNEINTFDFSVDGYNFATGGRDLGVRVYETKTNKLVQSYESVNKKMSTSGSSTSSQTFLDGRGVNQTMRIFCIKFHCDHQYIFLSGGWDNQLKVWDIRSNDGIKRSINGPHICGDSIDMSGNSVLCGQWTALRSLQEYDYTSGKMVKEYNYPHKDGAFLYCSQYANPGLIVAGGSGTNRVELIDMEENKSIFGYDLKAPVQAIDSTNNGRLIAVGGATDKFVIISVE